MEESSSSRGRLIRIGLLAGVLLLLGASLAWNFLSTDPSQTAATRAQLADFLATWRCLDDGHEIEDAAGRGPRTCPKCGKDTMYVSIRHFCPEDGKTYRVAFQYDVRSRPEQVKVEGGPWVPYLDENNMSGLRCPGGSVVMIPSDPVKWVNPPVSEEIPDTPPEE